MRSGDGFKRGRSAGDGGEPAPDTAHGGLDSRRARARELSASAGAVAGSHALHLALAGKLFGWNVGPIVVELALALAALAGGVALLTRIFAIDWRVLMSLPEFLGGGSLAGLARRIPLLAGGKAAPALAFAGADDDADDDDAPAARPRRTGKAAAAPPARSSSRRRRRRRRTPRPRRRRGARAG